MTCWQLSLKTRIRDKGILGKEVEETSGERKFEVLFFDENILVVRVETNDNGISGMPASCIQVYEKNSKSLPEVRC